MSRLRKVIEPIKFMWTPWYIIPLWIYIFVLLVGMFSSMGCSAPKKGWLPSDKYEMKLLIGQTTMEAIHAYREWDSNRLNSIPLNPDSEIDPRELDDPERKY